MSRLFEHKVARLNVQTTSRGGGGGGGGGGGRGQVGVNAMERLEGINPFKTNGISHKATYNIARMVH